MSAPAADLALLVPRVLGIAVALFVGMFALDAVGEGLPALIVHLLPAVLLLLVVALAWRRRWLGGVAFVGLGVAYAAIAWPRGTWMLTISAPLLIVGGLYFWSWRRSRGFKR